MEAIVEPVWKSCNIRAKGCELKYDLTERALKELGSEPDGTKHFSSRYDACNNAGCQLAGLANISTKSMLSS